jgi:hypothetical protein
VDLLKAIAIEIGDNSQGETALRRLEMVNLLA